MSTKINPIIDINNIFLQNGEYIIPVNQFAQMNYIYKPYYYVSNMGRIFSEHRNILNEMSQHPNKKGYLHVVLRTVDNSYANVLSHVLIKKSFHPKIPKNPIYPIDKNGEIDYEAYKRNKIEIDHKDGYHDIPYDNRIDNLRYVTHSINLIDAYANGQEEKILSDDDIKEIFRKIKSSYPRKIDKELAEEYHVTPLTIRSIRLGADYYADKIRSLNEQPIIYQKYKLSTEEIISIMDEIYKAYPKNIDEELAKKYGVTHHAIRRLRLGGSGDIVALGFKPVRYER